MTTLLRTLPFANPASAGLDPIAPSALEKAVYADPGVIDMWRADSRMGASGWVGRKAEKVLAPFRNGAVPTVQKIAAYGNKESLLFGTGNTNGELALANGFPAGSYSIVYFGRPGPGDAANMWGNSAAVDSSHGTFFQIGSTGSLTAVQNGASAGGSSGMYLYADGPQLVISSFDTADSRLRHRAHLGAKTWGGGAAVTADAERTFHLGGTGSASVQFASLDAGDIAEVMILNVPVLSGPNAALLATIEGYFAARYGLTA
ncbi:MAG TPA: hypothetical protein VMQ93_17220 [Novosphingobium sp.]|nr:hypothetical protein [Novosphingobium sp.]